MAVKQICIKVESQAGTLHRVTELLKLEGVNVRAISMLDPGEEAVVRMMVDDPERACNAFSSKGLEFFQEEVVAVEVPDHPGGLHLVLDCLSQADISVLQLYSYVGRSGPQAILILVVDRLDEATETLKKNWVRVFNDEVYGL